MLSAVGRRDREPFPDQYSSKRPKILSSIGNVSGSDPNIRLNVDSKQSDEKINTVFKSKPELLEVHNRPDIMNRNKRMFGSLVGHLGLAKKKLEDDSELIKKQQDMAASIAEKKTAEFMKYSEEKKITDEVESKKVFYSNILF